MKFLSNIFLFSQEHIIDDKNIITDKKLYRVYNNQRPVQTTGRADCIGIECRTDNLEDPGLIPGLCSGISEIIFEVFPI